MTGVDQLAQSLSGGNQQKVVIAKWLATSPRVLILDEPTRGVDIGAKVEVHRIVSDLAASGLGIILISSDLPEVLAMSDRILVLHEGRVTAEIARSDATEERVMFAATGQVGASGDAGPDLPPVGAIARPAARAGRPMSAEASARPAGPNLGRASSAMLGRSRELTLSA